MDSGGRIGLPSPPVGGHRMAEQTVFHFEPGRQSFEDFAKENGATYWYASELMRMLGYETLSSFHKVVNKATHACSALGIPIMENFVEEYREVDGERQRDFKLTRFACYLTAINGDPKKPEVAAAQAYFVTYAEAFRQYVQTAENVERVLVREEISDREKSLSGTVSTRDLKPEGGYAFFRDAGYRGMYNMPLKALKRRRGVPDGRTPLDFMGKTELAANLFRLTQTEEVIRAQDIRGQAPLQGTALRVGRKVRETMIELSGTPPEELPISGDIKGVKKDLKRTQREFAKADKRKALPAPKRGG